MPTFRITLQAGVGGLDGPASAARAARGDGVTAEGSDGSVATMTAPRSTVRSPGPPAHRAPVTSEATAAPSCSYGWFPQNKYKKRWVPLKVSRTRSKSTQRYSWTTSKHTDLEVVINADGDKYAGGLSGSVHERYGMTISPEWPNNTSKLVRAQWEYRRYRAWCFGGPPPSDPPRPLNLWKWRPNEALGYTKSEPNTPTFKCRTRGPVHSTITLRNAATVHWRGWFSILGIALDDTQTQSRQTALRIKPDSGQTPRYCGSGSKLRWSPFVRELR